MEQSARYNLDLSGVGTAPGGMYQDVNVQGVGTVHGDIDCVHCRVDGVAKISGNVKAQTVQINGKARVEGDVTGDEIILEGDMRIHGACAADVFRASGAFSITGLLNAGQVSIRLFGPGRVNEIGGETIRVEQEQKFSLFRRLKRLDADLIEGDDIYLEYTRAKTVRGNRIQIGPGSEIEHVEYRTELTVNPAAKVAERRQI